MMTFLSSLVVVESVSHEDAMTAVLLSMPPGSLVTAVVDVTSVTDWL
jgi:hypothetical protein